MSSEKNNYQQLLEQLQQECDEYYAYVERMCSLYAEEK